MEKDLKFGDDIEVYTGGGWRLTKCIQHLKPSDTVIFIETFQVEAFYRGQSFNCCFARSGEWRIVKKEKYHPFTFEERSHFRFKWIRSKELGSEGLIVYICADGVKFGAAFVNYKALLEEYEFINGDPCGILCNEEDK